MRLRRAVAKAFFAPSFTLSHWGERHGVDGLTYNPDVHLYYHYTALDNAPQTIRAIAAKIPTARTWLDVRSGTGPRRPPRRRRRGEGRRSRARRFRCSCR